MRLTGNDIIALIKKYHLENTVCRFSLPAAIAEQHRERKYYKPTDKEMRLIFKRYYDGETLSGLAKEYGANISYLSQQRKTYSWRKK